VKRDATHPATEGNRAGIQNHQARNVLQRRLLIEQRPRPEGGKKKAAGFLQSTGGDEGQCSLKGALMNRGGQSWCMLGGWGPGGVLAYNNGSSGGRGGANWPVSISYSLGA